MKFLLTFLAVALFTASFGQQDSLRLTNANGKKYRAALPAYGQIKLKNGEKYKGMLHTVDKETVMLKTMTEDEGTIREAKKNKLLTTQEKSDMLYIMPKSYKKDDVEWVSTIKQRGQKDNNIKKVGIYTMMGLTAGAAIIATIQDLQQGSTPVVGLGAVVLLTLLVLLLNKTARKKFSFYKWKIG